MRTRGRWLWCLLAIAALACGDDDDDTMEMPDGGMDGGAIGDGDGPPGNSNTGDPSNPGSTTAPQPFMCGDTRCFIPGQELADLLGGFGLPGLYQGCCTAEENACGLFAMSEDDGGVVTSECVPRPESDPRCPERTLLGVSQPSCCIEETQMCGVNTAQVGGGCTDFEGELVGALLGLEPIPCGGADLDGGMDEDGGTN